MVLDRLLQRLRRPSAAPEPTPAAPPPREPRLLGLSMVKNEQDIIEPFIRHNAPLLDALVILDNASLDETRGIALQCARELGNVIIADSDEFGYTQSERMTRLLHYCQGAFFADFVLPLDADEFLSADSRAALLEALGAVPPGGVGYLPWRTFVIMPGQEALAAEDPPRSFTHRRAAEQPPFFKAVLRLDGGFAPEVTLVQGNHDALRAGQPLPGAQLDGLPLLHFPVRSAAQVASKGVVGWAAYLSMNPQARQRDQGTQWRDMFDRVAMGGLGAVEAALPEVSMGYAQASRPIDWAADAVPEAAPAGPARRCSSGRFADPFALLARSWERSLQPAAPLVRLQRPEGGAGAGAGATSFDAAWHWDNLFFDLAPFRFVAEKHQPASVLDIGCGIGQYLALFKALGVAEVHGVDGVPAEATRGVLEPGEYAVHDLSQPLQLDRSFDLVLCVEVAEHLEAKDGATLLDSIARHAGQRIVFSAAEPDQPGNGHINCQPLADWLEEWAARGWVPDLVDSLGIRALSTMSWFRRNLVVLRPGTPAEGQAATAALAEIAARPYRWYAQAPGIREQPFAEPLFGPGEGYAGGAG